MHPVREKQQEPTEPKPHIFLVDDSPLIARASQILLSKSGFEVTICSNEYEAIETIKSQPDHFQLILTDQKMPHMTGIELAIKIREINQKIPTVLITGDLSEKESEQAAEAGIQYCLIKPISNQELVKTLWKALQV